MSICFKTPEKFPFLLFIMSLIFAFFSLNSCEYIPFKETNGSCEVSTQANTTMQDITEFWNGEPYTFTDDLIVEGYVISSDREGNFFNELIVQDEPTFPNLGMRILIELGDSHSRYPLGSKLLIHLRGLTLDQIDGEWRLGSPQELFGNIILGGIAQSKLRDVLERDCNFEDNISPLEASLTELESIPVSVLVSMQAVQFQEKELGNTFAAFAEETWREVEDCQGDQFAVVSSGYSDFQSVLLPTGLGRITGVLENQGQKKNLRLRSLEDLSFSEERCESIEEQEDEEEEQETVDLIISEIADPDNDILARFVELFNTGSAPIDLEGWKLQRFTNDNEEVGHEIDLSGTVLEAGQCLVIAANQEGFINRFGISPDLEAGGSSAANSNGDDNLLLIDSKGKIIDVFGRPGEDGSGTDHEFEDGRALRKSEILMGEPVYNFDSWFIWNDTGNQGTYNNPQQAPQDFSPGKHPDSTFKIK